MPGGALSRWGRCKQILFFVQHSTIRIQNSILGFTVHSSDSALKGRRVVAMGETGETRGKPRQISLALAGAKEPPATDTVPPPAPRREKKNSDFHRFHPWLQPVVPVGAKSD
jgi:hypothetical protein